jgi:Wzt C-terminal domain
LSTPQTPDEAHLLSGGPLRIQLDVDCDKPIDGAALTVQIRNQRGDTVFALETDNVGQPLGQLSGRSRITLDFGQIPLLDGTYPVSLQLRSQRGEMLAMRENVDAFDVLYRGRAEGLVLLEPQITSGRIN